MNENKEKLFYKLCIYQKKKKSIAHKICTVWRIYLALKASAKSLGYGLVKMAEETFADSHMAPITRHIYLYRPNPCNLNFV